MNFEENDNRIRLTTNSGTFIGCMHGDYAEFLGIPFATAERFRYARRIDSYEETVDATEFGDACPQTRTYYEHLEVPERLFYHNEFRYGQHFNNSENCLNLNIYAPVEGRNCPIIVFIHGGGFNSGAASESSFDGAIYARKGVIFVTIQYRVGVLGYLAHEDIFREYGRDGNFGFDDQFVAVTWVKEHIKEFGGDPDNITLMGQSAGAISIQYLCLCEKCKGLFQHAVMMSGGGLFPKFSLPRQVSDTREYWLKYMETAGCSSLDELRSLDVKALFTVVEKMKELRKDTVYNTMPVIDGYYMTGPIDRLIAKPLPIDYMIGFTNNDMYAVLMAKIGMDYARKHKGYVYYFDIDAPGNDKNCAFHSSDLRYVCGTLNRSLRPYTEADYRISEGLTDYLSSFARTGNPNSDTKELPKWSNKPGRALRITSKGFEMAVPNYFKLLWHTLTKGEPT